MSRHPILTHAFVLAVVRRDDKYLLIEETDGSWYLPGGRVEVGETLLQAVQREAREQAGVTIKVTGVVRLQYTPLAESARLRVIFLADVEGGDLKREPDGHSNQTRWVSTGELDELPLRSVEVEELLDLVAGGLAIAPLEILEVEE